MRIPEYLSPSAIDKWDTSNEQYYVEYLAENRYPREPQTEPMSVGSAFDAYVKSYLFENLFGETTDEFALENILVSQVEEHNINFAREAGKICFDAYKTSGALADLLLDLSQSLSEPRFEFTVRGDINGIPLLGKPDVYFIHKTGIPIILDFKVNGYCATRNTSPKRGYIKLRDGWVGAQSRTHNCMHKDCIPMRVDGVLINIAENLETVNISWARQLATYAWLMGAQVGGEFICAIDQLACSPGPKIRIAEHRLRIGQQFQHTALNNYKNLWEIINSDHIFRHLSKEDSAKRCLVLDEKYNTISSDPVLQGLNR